MSARAAAIVIAIVIVVIVVVVVVIPRLTPAPEPTYELTVSGGEGGSVTAPGEDTSPHEAGTVVNLVA